MSRLRPTLLVAPLFVCLFASSSDAAPGGRAATGTKQATKQPPRKTVVVSKQVQQRLAQPTTKQKPLRYDPFTRQEVRKAVPAQQRPARQQTGAAPKRMTNTELTNELNAIEKRINAYGYSLRQGGKAVYREHKPDRQRLAKQIAKVDEVAGKKPARAPLSESKLRERVRQQAKRETPARAPVHQSMGGFGPATASWGWQPMLGETAYAAAFLDTQARFEAALNGSNPGLHGSVSARAGGYLLGERVEVLAVHGSFDANLDGSNRVKLVATLPFGDEWVLVDESSQTSLSKTETYPLAAWAPSIKAPLSVVGFQIMVDLVVDTELSVRTDLYLDPSLAYGSVSPKIKVAVTGAAYVDAPLVSAQLNGKLTLLDAEPLLMGFATLDGDAGPIAEIHAWIDAKFLFGSLWASLKLGIGSFSTTFESDIVDFTGWTRRFSVFETSFEL